MVLVHEMCEMKWSDSDELVRVKEYQWLLQLQAREEDLKKLANPNLVQKWHALLHILYQQDGNRHTKVHWTWQKERGYAACDPYAPSGEPRRSRRIMRQSGPRPSRPSAQRGWSFPLQAPQRSNPDDPGHQQQQCLYTTSGE